MKRKAMTALALFAAALVLSACSQEQAAPESSWTKGSQQIQSGSQQTKESQSSSRQPETQPSQPSQASQEPQASREEQEPEDVRVLMVETGQIYDGNLLELGGNSYQTATVGYPVMRLSGEDAKACPQLAGAVDGLMEQIRQNCLEQYTDLIGPSEEAFKNDPGSITYEISESILVRRADTVALSLLAQGRYNAGGVHGYCYSAGVTLDSQTGELLSLTDVVTDVSRLPGLVQEQLEIYWDTDYLYQDLDLEAYFAENLEEIQWVLDYNGLTVYFNPYEIAPYASGTLNVTIAFAEHPEIFAEKYMQVPESYGVEFPEDGNFYYDVDNDGVLDCLMVTQETMEEPETIWLNGVWYETVLVRNPPVLMHTADGSNYLYLEEYREHPAYAVYELSQGAIEPLGYVYAMACYFENDSGEEEPYYTRAVLTDPECFLLESWADSVLLFWHGYDSYHIGDQYRLPEQNHDWYLIPDRPEFTLTKALACSQVDEAGNAVGEVRLNAGDKVIYTRTDGKSWMEFLLPGEDTVRIPVEVDLRGYMTVDGVRVEELFDGFMLYSW